MAQLRDQSGTVVFEGDITGADALPPQWQVDPDGTLNLLDGSGNVRARLAVDGTLALFDASGNFVALLDNGGALQLLDTGGDGGATLMPSGGSFLFTRTGAGEASAAASFGAGNGSAFRVLRDGVPVLRNHAAPSDAALAAGDLAFWYDQTNGAAKLMLKGKTANGTVVTAAVPLL